MTTTDAVKALLLGGIEGLTEFLPVSSTGHLLLAQRFLGLDFDDPTFSKTFDVLIQLGAVLAILLVYARKLIGLLLGVGRDPAARRFILGVLVAFLPAAAIGGLFGSAIKARLFDPLVVCCALVAGGLVLLVVDDAKLQVRRTAVEQFSLRMCLTIGFVQCLALIPGVSRSGSSIVGAMLMGADKRSAAEFSFWLAMPTMAGAFAYDLYKNRNLLDVQQLSLIGLGFGASFVTGLIVVGALLRYVSRRGFAVFGWWRIVVGGLGLFALGLGA